MNLQEKINRLTSNRPSEWKQEAAERIAAQGWKRNSRAVALRVLSVLQERKMNQSALAALMGVSQQQISKIVGGKENLTFETVDKLENALGITLIRVDIPVGQAPTAKTPNSAKK